MSKKKKKGKKVKSEKKEEIFFDPYFSERAKMEIKVSEYGVSFVGNMEGYLSFSRFFNYLAEVHMLIREESPQPETNTVNGYGAYHFSDYVNKEKLKQGDFIFRPGPINNLKPDEAEQDVLFWLSDVTGPAFWQESEETEKKEK